MNASYGGISKNITVRFNIDFIPIPEQIDLCKELLRKFVMTDNLQDEQLKELEIYLLSVLKELS